MFDRVSNGWIQIRTDILSVLIRVQTVCKENQQMTFVVATLSRKEFNTLCLYLQG